MIVLVTNVNIMLIFAKEVKFNVAFILLANNIVKRLYFEEIMVN